MTTPCQWVGGYLGVSSLSWWFREWGRERERKRREKGPTLHLNSGLLGRACVAPFELYITGLTSPTSNCQDDQFAPFGQPISGQATVLSDAAIQRPAMCQQSTTPPLPPLLHMWTSVGWPEMGQPDPYFISACCSTRIPCWEKARHHKPFALLKVF